MNFEIGKTYRIEPEYKKTLIEEEIVVSKDDPSRQIMVATVWRGGAFSITPVCQEDIESLEQAVSVGDTICLTDFAEFECLDTFDGCHVDIEFLDTYEWTEEEKTQILENCEEFFEWYYDRNGDGKDIEIFDFDHTRFFINGTIMAALEN